MTCMLDPGENVGVAPAGQERCGFLGFGSLGLSAPTSVGYSLVCNMVPKQDMQSRVVV